jgi:hypothetical protein
VVSEPVADLLIRNIPRDLVMGVEDALMSGARRAFECSEGMDVGHLASVMGHMRHFHMNERFQVAMTVAGAEPTPLKGNAIVVGRSGIFTLGRINISRGLWNHGNRSKARRKLSQENRCIEPLVQPELFGLPVPIDGGAAFFVAEFSGSLKHSPEAPLVINIAVPDRAMEQWLFWEPLTTFLSRYNTVPEQKDGAVPTLKAGVGVRSA